MHVALSPARRFGLLEIVASPFLAVGTGMIRLETFKTSKMIIKLANQIKTNGKQGKIESLGLFLPRRGIVPCVSLRWRGEEKEKKM